MEMKFYICEICGNIVAAVKESGVSVECCGQPMTRLEANTTDAATEKHVPAVKVDGNSVHIVVGETAHPMLPEHHIEWIAIQTDRGNQRKVLEPGAYPEACFMLCDGERLVAAYEHCSLHGLWMKKLQ